MNDRSEHDEYVSGVRAELTGGYWLDTPGRGGRDADGCRWCEELLKAEAAARARRKGPA
ncbi:hypothetical protein [Streptomyces sp. NPDC050264]|uniref:hypothetical protein n=1 Tax=Streptomyces sp. NPDC050264 TaxID=3155038 RepID=UPI00342B1694